jgi:hypothetical protein
VAEFLRIQLRKCAQDNKKSDTRNTKAQAATGLFNRNANGVRERRAERQRIAGLCQTPPYRRAGRSNSSSAHSRSPTPSIDS